MNTTILWSLPLTAAVMMTGLFAAAPAAAQAQSTGHDVCVGIDEAHDTLTPVERTAARLLVERQFTTEGWHVLPEGCRSTYLLAHIQLGQRITVTLSGPEGRREGSTLGLDDLPALYSQMVRSIVTGRPMEGMNVIDRTNVTTLQSLPPQRVASEHFSYARLGFGNFGPSIGLGYRAEISDIALDVSFVGTGGGSSSYYTTASTSRSFSLIRVEALRFTHRTANVSAYYGGGFSWGVASHSDGYAGPSWYGSGLQGEATFGYEIGRASTLRAFVEADATVPFYRLTSYRAVPSRYAPSFTIAVGVGWQRDRR